MRILVAYDGTPGADAELADLARAGLPAEAEVRLVTVADADVPWFAPESTSATGRGVRFAEQRRERLVANARQVAERGSARLREAFPRWKVETFVRGGSPASAILLHADAWLADLVVVGSRGRPRPARAVLGSVARRVVTECRCSVRVARTPPRTQGPVKALVCHDGGDGGRAALHAAASRAWPEGSELVALAVHTPDAVTVLAAGVDWDSGWPMTIAPSDRASLRKVVDADVQAAARPGLGVQALIKLGPPTPTILRLARSLDVDCMFVGATTTGRLARFVLGSVSSAVADRARCSVEVVRISGEPA